MSEARQKNETYAQTRRIEDHKSHESLQKPEAIKRLAARKTEDLAMSLQS